MASDTEITSRILQHCREMGFALAGVCDATPTMYEEEVRAWLASGQHGEMDYMARNLELRLDPSVLVPGAQSIICVADRYHSGDDSGKHSESAAPMGRIARYARGDDYHRVMRHRLRSMCRTLTQQHPGHQFRACVDTAPVFEREHAQRAGLGAIGKNTMLLERSVGSWLLLGEIITTLRLEPTDEAEPDPCGTCTRCIDACPTNAIAAEGWRIDATRCISYLTIEHRSVIDEVHHEAIGDWLFGCDICQEVCPHNQPKSKNAHQVPHPAYAERNKAFDLLGVLGWNEDDRTRILAGSALKRARLDMLKRNAIIVAANAIMRGMAPAALRTRIDAIARSIEEHEMVVRTAQAALRRLASVEPRAASSASSRPITGRDIDTAAQDT